MKSLLAVLFPLLLLPAIALAQPVAAFESDLMVVPDDGHLSLQDLRDAGLTAVHRMNGFYLAAETQAAPDGLDVVRLPLPLPGQAYYTVGVRTKDRIAEVATLVDLLYTSDHELVVAATPEQISRVAGLGCEVALVFDRPLREAAPTVIDPRVYAKDIDPVIADIVAAVNGTNIDAQVQRLQDFVTRYASHDSCSAAAAYIRTELISYGIPTVYFDQFSASYAPNVVGEIPGVSEPEKIVVVGGHYDSTSSNSSYAPGADDNASGTVCMMECARVLAGHQFDFTVRFLAFGAEELGLIGSEAYASAAQAAGEQIVAVLNVDMIGYLATGDIFDLDVVDNASSLWLRDLAFSVAAEYVPELPLVDGSLPFGASSDHASFWGNGFDAIMFFEDTGNYSPYIHSADDVVGLSYNSPELAVASVKIVVATLATVAQPYRLAIVHEPLTDTVDMVQPYAVTATITAAGALDAGSLQLYWGTGAGYTAVPMTTTGAADEFTADIPAQGQGTFVYYYISAADTEAYTSTHPAGAPQDVHGFFVGVTGVDTLHDFEVDQGWTVGAVGDDATSGLWVRVDPNGVFEGSLEIQPEDDHTENPGTMCYVTGNDPAGSSQGTDDIDGGVTTLLSPVFDLSDLTHAWVGYRRWYSNDTGNAPGEDVWQVEVNSNDGQGWQVIESTTASDRSWREVQVYLPAVTALTDQMQFRFIAADEGSGSVVEAGLDDFALIIFEPLSDVGDPGTAPRAVVLGQAVPNPFNPKTTINFSVPDEGSRVSLSVYDLSGRRVATLLQDVVVSGRQAVVWDGTDDRRQRVSAGVYLYRLRAGDEVRTRKLTLVK